MTYCSAFTLSLLMGLVGPATPSAGDGSHPAPSRHHRIVGVTVDSTAHLARTIRSLRHLHRPVWTRLVLDVDAAHPASINEYDGVAPRLAGVGRVMAELVDSSALRQITVHQVARRTRAAIAAMGSDVDVWEVGNEVNGNWTGAARTVARKVVRTLSIVRNHGGTSAVTLYENRGCGDGPGEKTPTAWSRDHLSRRTRAKLDYVYLSYYEAQCRLLRPSDAQWTKRFRALHRLFPNAKLGFGEIGMPRPATPATRRRARSIIRHYYGLRLPVPAFVGGDFYWYYVEDMTPWHSSSLWRVLKSAT
jgi:hypothetical protein